MTAPAYTTPHGAANYARRFRGAFGHYLSALEDEVILGLAGPLSGCRVLDLGTGTGRFASMAHRQGARAILGVDLYISMLIQARKDHPQTAFRWAAMDVRRLALAPNGFDFVFAVGTLEDLPPGTSLGQVLAQVAAVLAKNGRVIFTVWNRERWLPWDWLDFTGYQRSQFTEEEVRVAAAAAGLRVVHCTSTLYEPRRLLPPLMRLAGTERVRHRIAQWLIATNRWLGRWRWSRSRGREFIILAAKD